MVEKTEEFWEKKELKDCVEITEKDKVKIYLTVKNSKEYAFLQKEYKNAKGDWLTGKGFSLILNEETKKLFPALVNAFGKGE